MVPSSTHAKIDFWGMEGIQVPFLNQPPETRGPRDSDSLETREYEICLAY